MTQLATGPQELIVPRPTKVAKSKKKVVKVAKEGEGVLDEKMEALKKQIKNLHQSCVKSTRLAMCNAIHCGCVLITARNTLKHGIFHKWLKTNSADINLQPRTAQRYMRKAEEFIAFVHKEGHCVETLEDPLKQFGPAVIEAFAKSVVDSNSSTSDPNEWRSSDEVIDAVKAVMGEMDCDTCGLPNEWQTAHAEINILREQDALSRHTPWGRTNWICPGHQVDPAPWFHRANYEREIGNLDQAILCLPESALNLPRRLFEFPVAITAEPLTVTKRVRGEEIKEQLPTRSLFVYVTASKPDVERFARAFCDIAVAFAPVLING